MFPGQSPPNCQLTDHLKDRKYNNLKIATVIASQGEADP